MLLAWRGDDNETSSLLKPLARGFRRVTVHGQSMVPGLLPGDRLLVVPVRRLRPGQVVAVPDPRHPARLLVKRVAAVDRSGARVTVLGDNPPASTDSRDFGPVPRASVVGRAVYRYAPAGRAGRLPAAWRRRGGGHLR